MEVSRKPTTKISWRDKFQSLGETFGDENVPREPALNAAEVFGSS